MNPFVTPEPSPIPNNPFAEVLPTAVAPPKPTEEPQVLSNDPFENAPAARDGFATPSASGQYNWNSFWRDYHPMMELDKLPRPALLLITNRSVSASNRLEVVFERQQELLGYIATNFCPIRVDSVANESLLREYKVAYPPAIVRLDGDGRMVARQLFQNRPTAEDLSKIVRGTD